MEMIELIFLFRIRSSIQKYGRRRTFYENKIPTEDQSAKARGKKIHKIVGKMLLVLSAFLFESSNLHTTNVCSVIY